MQKKLRRIMQVLPELNSGGVERGTLDLNRALVQSGYQAFCVSNGGALARELEEDGGTHIQLPVHSKNPLTIWLNIARLEHAIKHYSIDLIHVRSRAPAWSVYWASRRCAIPMVSTFHGQYGSHSKLKRWYNSGMLRANTTIAVSDFILQHILRTYPNQKTQLHRIYRGIDTNYFCPTTINNRAHQLKKQWQLECETNKVILLPGRLTRLKGHAVFIEALARIKDRPIAGLIVGATKGRQQYIQELVNLAQSLGLRTDGPKQQLYFVGPCNDMPAAYTCADIVVSASTKPEAFGRIACEAQAMGKPVVATQHGGSSETLHPAQLSGACTPNNAQSLSNAISNQLALTNSQLTDLGKISRKHIIEHFSLEQMCHQTIAVYESLLADKR